MLAKATPLAKACNSYADRFGSTVPPSLSMEFSEEVLIARIEKALVENKPVPEWKPLPEGAIA